MSKPLPPLSEMLLATPAVEMHQPTMVEQFMAMATLIVPMFLIFYFLIIRPQKKKEEERHQLLQKLKKNDRVLTSGGIYGVVLSAKDNEVMLRLDDNVKVRFSRNAIVSVESAEGKAEVAA